MSDFQTYPTPQPTPSSLWTIDNRWFDVLEPIEPHITEIAHGLSQTCRYGGHVPYFYSVAEHSVMVAGLLDTPEYPPGYALAGLLHDAAEAYIGDMVNPVKHLLPKFGAIEAQIMLEVDKAFGIEFDADMREAVHQADRAAYDFEVHNLRFRSTFWEEMLPRHAKYLFLEEFDELTMRLG